MFRQLPDKDIVHGATMLQSYIYRNPSYCSSKDMRAGESLQNRFT